MISCPLALIVSSPTRRGTVNEAVGYVRVSSEEQADSGLGLQAQRQRIAAFCAMKELRLADVYEDTACPAVSRWRAERLAQEGIGHLDG
jgi:site-specific DNA recombinase